MVQEAADLIAVPIFCNLSHHTLPERYKWPPLGTSGHMMTAGVFEAYLSDYLMREIILPKDDRPVEKMGKNNPFFYQFLFDGTNYFI